MAADIMVETWKDIKDYEGRYQASDLGMVKTFVQAFKTNKGVLKYGIDTNGYPIVKLYSNGKGRTRKVHRVIAETFIENPNNLPQVNHKDGNKLNNAVENLEWCDQSHNMKHAIRTGLIKKHFGEQSSQAKFTEKQINELRAKHPQFTMKELAIEYGMSKTNVCDIIKRKIWNHI